MGKTLLDGLIGEIKEPGYFMPIEVKHTSQPPNMITQEQFIKLLTPKEVDNA